MVADYESYISEAFQFTPLREGRPGHVVCAQDAVI